uniref:BY PROTMAP: gi/472581010/gb/EMS18771.1/ zinc finger, MYND-type protein [Rhodosporidium toruloides NP11] n=1 Tax=Rhodotorula toruloides TaxID=5286 RepID=A0A0K3CGK3_RHOTO
MVEGDCLVCGNRTTKRCTRCLDESGIDLFFCSPECQKLVWRGHKLFCCANALPFVLPFLTPAEAETAIANLDKPAIPLDDKGKERDVPISQVARDFLKLSRRELATIIMLALAANRVDHGPFTEGSFRTDVLNWLIKQHQDLVSHAVLPMPMRNANRAQATLLHGLVCLLTLVRVGRGAGGDVTKAQLQSVASCMTA